MKNGDVVPINEEHKQVEVARELEALAKTLAHSTRDIPTPSDSYALLAELATTIESIEQGCRQIAARQERAFDGTHYFGEDERGDGGTGTVTAADELRRAAAALDVASTAVRAAQSANGVVRWVDTVQSGKTP